MPRNTLLNDKCKEVGSALRTKKQKNTNNKYEKFHKAGYFRLLAAEEVLLTIIMIFPVKRKQGILKCKSETVSKIVP